jgi:hypothetical protein
MILPDDHFEKCPEYADVDAKIFNTENLEIVIESDYDVFLNGSIKFLLSMQSPWNAEYYGEQFVRNTWVRSPVQKKFFDICPHIHSPLEIWYNIMKGSPGCPLNKGVSTR